MPELDLSALPLWAGWGILAGVALVAGVINTMAGGGSLLVLPVLIALGFPAPVANGTLRVGVLLQSAAALVPFHARGVREYALVGRLAIPILLGAAAGTALATRLSDDVLRPVFGVLLALWAVVLVFKPGRFGTGKEQPEQPRPLTHLLAFGVGAYGGFIQAGVGFPLLALLITHLGYPVVRANAAKVALVLAFTLVSLPMFALAGQVAWREGAALAVGSMIGGWLGSRWQLKSGESIVRWFVIVMVAISGVAMVVSSV